MAHYGLCDPPRLCDCHDYPIAWCPTLADGLDEEAEAERLDRRDEDD
jgi:hypothetical protein